MVTRATARNVLFRGLVPVVVVAGLAAGCRPRPVEVDLQQGDRWSFREARLRGAPVPVTTRRGGIDIDARSEGSLTLSFVSADGTPSEVACGYYSPGDSFVVLVRGNEMRCVPREVASQVK